MTVKLTGKEWHIFMADEAWWPDGRYFEEEILRREGEGALEDYEGISDTNKLRLAEGSVMIESRTAHMDDCVGTLEAYFKRWRKAQTKTWLVVEVDKGQRNKVVEAAKNVGGKVLE